MASPTGTARMPTQGSWRPLVMMSVSAPLRSTVRRGDRIDEVGLTAKRATTGWPVEMPPRMPPAWLDRKLRAVIAHPHLVGVFLAGQFGGAKAGADLDALDRVDAHQRRGEIGIELGVDRRAEPRRHAFGDDLDHRADRRAALADAVEIVLEERGLVLVRAEERIARDLVPVPFVAIDLVRAHLHQRAAHVHAGHDLAGDGAGRDPRRGLARRGAAAAAIIAQAVFGLIGEVGMARDETCP